MRQREIIDNLGKVVKVNRWGDLYMCSELRPIIGKEVTLVKQCKNGLLQVQHAGKFYSIPPRNADAVALDIGEPRVD